MALFSSSGLASTPSSATITKPSADIQPYAKNVLDKGNALLNAPTPAYTGQMTAGPSALQTQAWDGLAGLTLPNTMTQAGQNLLDIQGKAQDMKFDPNTVSQYMNPYLMNALNPQLDEARRQSQISSQPAMAKLTQAGGYGGGRQAIMESENQRNLNTNLANITGQGYKAAYDDAMKSAQYSADFGLKSLQAGTTANQAAGNIGAQEAQYGLQNLQALSTAGGIQQGQNQAGLNSQYNEWLRQQNYLPTALKNQQELIRAMPGGTQTENYTAKPSGLQAAAGSVGLVSKTMEDMKKAGLTPDAITKAIKALGINPDTLQSETKAIENTAQPGQEGYGWQYFTDGTVIDPSGNYYRDGEIIWSPEGSGFPEADPYDDTPIDYSDMMPDRDGDFGGYL
jgi:hypothetical protein